MKIKTLFILITFGYTIYQENNSCYASNLDIKSSIDYETPSRLTNQRESIVEWLNYLDKQFDSADEIERKKLVTRKIECGYVSDNPNWNITPFSFSYFLRFS